MTINSVDSEGGSVVPPVYSWKDGIVLHENGEFIYPITADSAMGTESHNNSHTASTYIPDNNTNNTYNTALLSDSKCRLLFTVNGIAHDGTPLVEAWITWYDTNNTTVKGSVCSENIAVISLTPQDVVNVFIHTGGGGDKQYPLHLSLFLLHDLEDSTDGMHCIHEVMPVLPWVRSTAGWESKESQDGYKFSHMKQIVLKLIALQQHIKVGFQSAGGKHNEGLVNVTPPVRPLLNIRPQLQLIYRDGSLSDCMDIPPLVELQGLINEGAGVHGILPYGMSERELVSSDLTPGVRLIQLTDHVQRCVFTQVSATKVRGNFKDNTFLTLDTVTQV